MTQECLNNWMILHVHKDKTGSLNLTKVARQFSNNDRRRHFLVISNLSYCYFITIIIIVFVYTRQ